jgi:hypothetical protein
VPEATAPAVESASRPGIAAAELAARYARMRPDGLVAELNIPS